MIKHVVMFKMNEANTQRTDELIKALEALPRHIDVIDAFEVGKNIASSERAFDLVLISTFANADHLETYRVHPEHQKVVTMIKEVCEKTHVVDYNI